MSEEPRRRMMLAIAIPFAAIALIAVFLWAMSRILLAASEELSPVIGLLFAVNILIAAGIAATFPRRKGVVVALVVAVMVPVIAAGVVGAVVGERPVHDLAAEIDGEEGHGEEPAGETGGTGGATEVTLVAESVLFDTDHVSLTAETEVTVTLDNQDEGVPHNFAMYTDESATEEIFVGEIFPGTGSADASFTSPAAGEYFFRCDVHPTTMVGTVTVG